VKEAEQQAAGKFTGVSRGSENEKYTVGWLVVSSAGIFKQSMGARNRVGIRLSYRPARLHSLAELVPWNRFLGSLKV
jgi:hypothetical protein